MMKTAACVKGIKHTGTAYPRGVEEISFSASVNGRGCLYTHPVAGSLAGAPSHVRLAAARKAAITAFTAAASRGA